MAVAQPRAHLMLERHSALHTFSSSQGANHKQQIQANFLSSIHSLTHLLLYKYSAVILQMWCLCLLDIAFNAITTPGPVIKHWPQHN